LHIPMRTAAAALDVRPVSQLLKALGDETRLRIVALLAHGELCVVISRTPSGCRSRTRHASSASSAMPGSSNPGARGAGSTTAWLAK